MKICHNCQAEQPSNLATTCMYCGYDLKEDTDVTNTKNSSTDSDDNGFSQLENNPNIDDVSLSIESPSDMLSQGNNSESDNSESLDDDDEDLFSPIGQSAPFMPEQEENQYEEPKTGKIEKENDLSEGYDETGKIKKLSDEELKSIEKSLYQKNKFLNKDQKKELIQKIEKVSDEPKQSFNNAPIIPPKKNEPKEENALNNLSQAEEVEKPKSSKPRSLALFHKNWIQIPSVHNFYENDQFDFDDHTYVLKPKNMTKVWLSLFSAAASIILLLFAVSYFSGSGSDLGRITGVALDDNDRPLVSGAEIILPESGKKTRTNPQGFFQFAHIPSGTHKIEYRVDGELIRVDYATVVNNKENLIFLRPDQELVAQNNQVPEKIVQKPASTEVKKKTTTVAQKPTTITKTTKKEPVYRKDPAKYSKITLSSNVGGAKLTIDGQVLGAGNLTYSKLKPGNHEYTVSADGYNPISGSLYLEKGENKRLSVNLSPLASKEKEKSYKENDYFYSGINSYKSGDYNNAISDLSKTIEKYPSNAEAYFYRGQSYSKSNQNEDAFNDFIRAAEIYQFKKEYNNSLKSYNQALGIDDESINAYIGRGNLFLQKGEAMAATADFDMIRKFDRRNYQAYFGLGKAAYQQQRYNKAVDYFKDARSINDKNPLVHQYLMLAYMSKDDLKNVQKSFDKFKDIASDEQLQRFKTNKTYSSIIRVIETD